MNVAIFTNNYLPNPYGVTVSVETLRFELEKRGHTVYIFAPKWKGYQDNNPNTCPLYFRCGGFGRVFRYPSIDIEFKFRFPLPIPYSWRINKILKNLDIDIIHSQHPNLLGSVAARWAKKKKIPLVFTWHTLYDKYTNFIPLIPSQWAAKYIIRKAVKYANKADAVIAPTDSIIPILKNWGVKKEITAIATGIKTEEFKNADGNTIRKKYDIDDGEILLLLVSRLTEEKNVEFVFRAVKNILRENKKVKFLTVGDGYLLPKLKKFCEDNKIFNQAIFSGLIPHRETKNYYAAADIFIYGSKSETQGIIPLEASYMKLPIVAVNSTGISSLLRNNESGFLTQENEEEFSQAVLRLIDNAELRKKIGEQAGKVARENFTSDICVEKMLKVYREAIVCQKQNLVVD